LNTLTLLALTAIFLFTSIISVVTGSTSLVTVPAMLQFGIDPRVAVATNMFALIFMSVGGTLPFLRTGTIDKRRLPLLGILTLIGSVAGAWLLTIIAAKNIPLLVALFMIAVAIFSVLNPQAGVVTVGPPTKTAEFAGYAATLRHFWFKTCCAPEPSAETDKVFGDMQAFFSGEMHPKTECHPGFRTRT
jgi:uncharacterized protein